MVELIRDIDPNRIRQALAAVHDEIRANGRDPADVQVLAATKYVALEDLPILAEAGLEVLGENRAQDLAAKAVAFPGFTWDFIGNLQSRKVASVLAHARYIHSVASDSVLEALRRHAGPQTRVLIQVNVAGEVGKGGIAPAELGSFIERCPVAVVGLMTMPPQASGPAANRPHFAALRELAEHHGLRELSMGTSQDYRAAVAEGATIIRLGTTLYREVGS